MTINRPKYTYTFLMACYLMYDQNVLGECNYRAE